MTMPTNGDDKGDGLKTYLHLEGLVRFSSSLFDY